MTVDEPVSDKVKRADCVGTVEAQLDGLGDKVEVAHTEKLSLAEAHNDGVAKAVAEPGRDDTDAMERVGTEDGEGVETDEVERDGELLADCVAVPLLLAIPATRRHSACAES